MWPASILRRGGLCPNCPLTAWAALPFSFRTSQIRAAPAMRCGSEPSRRIDPRGHLGRAGVVHVLDRSGAILPMEPSWNTEDEELDGE